MLRYSKLNDEQLQKRLVEIAKSEHVSYDSDGLDAIIFTAQGDMRQVRILSIAAPSPHSCILRRSTISNRLCSALDM